MFETGLYSLVTGNAPMLATIPGGMMPVLVPEQATYPCLTYKVVTDRPYYTLDTRQYQEPLVQFDVWSETSYLDCKTALKALRNLLDCYQGTLSDGTHVLSTLRENTIDNWEFDGRTWRITAEYRFTIVEAA
jgi:hypothetical protein